MHIYIYTTCIYTHTPCDSPRDANSSTALCVFVPSPPPCAGAESSVAPLRHWRLLLACSKWKACMRAEGQENVLKSQRPGIFPRNRLWSECL